MENVLEYQPILFFRIVHPLSILHDCPPLSPAFPEIIRQPVVMAQLVKEASSELPEQVLMLPQPIPLHQLFTGQDKVKVVMKFVYEFNGPQQNCLGWHVFQIQFLVIKHEFPIYMKAV